MSGMPEFTWRATKDGRVLIGRQGRTVTTLAGARARRFLDDLDGTDERGTQLLLARATGNFRRGNE